MNENCQIQTLFAYPQEFLETCGGDQSSPMSWPQLTSAYFSYNWITKLDASLVCVFPLCNISNIWLTTIFLTELFTRMIISSLFSETFTKSYFVRSQSQQY